MVLNFHLVLASPTTVHFLQHAKAYAMLVMKSNINEQYTGHEQLRQHTNVYRKVSRDMYA